MRKRLVYKYLLIIAFVAIALYAIHSHGVKRGMDLSGGSRLIFKIDTSALPEEEKGRLGLTEETMRIIRKRIDPAGVLEPRIQRKGGHEIIVELPFYRQTYKIKAEDTLKDIARKFFADEEKWRKIYDANKELIEDPENLRPGTTIKIPGIKAEEMKRKAEQLGTLEFRLVVDEHSKDPEDKKAYDEAVAGRVPSGYKWMDLRSAQGTVEKLLIKFNDPFKITGGDLAKSYATTNRYGLPIVGFDIRPGARARFARLTELHLKERLGIILNDKLQSAPVINERIYERGVIEGRFTAREVQDYVDILNSGKLPAPLILISEDYEGPTLGQDSIRRGFRAAILGLILVLIFMAFYYLASGLVADFALILNLILVIGGLALFRATLTLPGIAGLVLTVGMSVDANVLIFERIREEKAAGKALGVVIKDGYARAFRTIFDANVTTLITALILFQFGTGPIRGFAVTLSLGIIFSMFGALFVTRAIFDGLLIKGWLKKFAMFQAFKQPSLPFLRYSRWAIMGSLCFMIIGLGTFLHRGEENLDIDFTGGALFQLQLKEPKRIGEVRNEVAQAGFPDAEVQSLTGELGGVAELKASEFAIRIRLPGGTEEEQETQISQIKAALGSAFKDYAPLRKISVSFREVRELKSPVGERQVEGYYITAELEEALPESEIRSGLEAIGLSDARLELHNPEGSEEGITRFSITTNRTDVEEMKTGLSEAFFLSDPFTASHFIGGSIASEMKAKAIFTIIIALGAIVIYIWVRFGKLSFGLAAVVALFHDVLFTLGAISIGDWLGDQKIGQLLYLGDIKLSLPMIAAFLTIVGYSLNDTIVVFDRIRENLQRERRRKLEPQDAGLIQLSINQTLGRTLLTSLTTFIVVFVLYLVGGAAIHGFAFALIIGVIVGTYSSIFIASPLLVWSRIWKPEKLEETSGLG